MRTHVYRLCSYPRVYRRTLKAAPVCACVLALRSDIPALHRRYLLLEAVENYCGQTNIHSVHSVALYVGSRAATW